MAVGGQLNHSFLDSSAALTGSRCARAILSHIHTCCLNSFLRVASVLKTEGNPTVAHMLPIRFSFLIWPSDIAQ